MPVRLTTDDLGFLTRVQGYCDQGLAEPEMAKREGVPMNTLRNRLFRSGFLVEKKVSRRVARTGSGEPLVELIESGGIETLDDPEPAEEVAA